MYPLGEDEGGGQRVVDLSILVTKDMVGGVFDHERKSVVFGHLGTHFDVMDKEFPLSLSLIHI